MTTLFKNENILWCDDCFEVYVGVCPTHRLEALLAEDNELQQAVAKIVASAVKRERNRQPKTLWQFVVFRLRRGGDAIPSDK